MEFLKFKITFFVFVAFVCSLNAQNGQLALEEAFSKSYTQEKNGDFSASMDEIKKIYNEESYEMNLRLGWLNYNAGLFDESIIFYSRAQQLKPYSEESKFGLILPQSALGKWDKVILTYNDILEINPNNTVALYRFGLVYYGRKDYTSAYPLFKKLVDLYPFGYDGLLMLGWTSYFLGNNNEAKVLFNKVKLYSPGDASANEGLKLIK
jgi:tetratricopeptide (TPR) repeat protein